MGTIFFAGVYGVGKSSVIRTLSRIKKIPYYSASEIISQKSGEAYNTNKAVSDINFNQDILISSVSSILKNSKKVLLAGHFCILSSCNKVQRIPNYVYDQLALETIILLEAPTDVIVSNIYARDHSIYNYDTISSLQRSEREYAIEIADQLSCNFLIYNMTYSSKDIISLAKYL